MTCWKQLACLESLSRSLKIGLGASASIPSSTAWFWLAFLPGSLDSFTSWGTYRLARCVLDFWAGEDLYDGVFRLGTTRADNGTGHVCAFCLQLALFGAKEVQAALNQLYISIFPLWVCPFATIPEDAFVGWHLCPGPVKKILGANDSVVVRPKGAPFIFVGRHTKWQSQ